MNIELNKIIIPKAFKNSEPKSYKMNAVRNYYYEYGEIDKPIVIDDSNTLIDGYIRYLIAVENKLDVIPFVYVQEYKDNNKIELTPFITGIFEDSNKEYVWKNDKNIPIEIGDKVEVKSWNYQNQKVGSAVVTVTNVFKSDLSSMLRHRSVIKKVV